jgi:putative hemolysin
LDDDIPLLASSLIFLGCTLYALLLSGAEAAFSSLPKSTLHELKAAHEDGQTSRVTHWLDNQERLFATLLIGKTVMVTGVVISAAALALISPTISVIGIPITLALTGLVCLLYLFVFIEWLPRLLVTRYSEMAVRISAVLVQFTSWFLWPLVTPLIVLNRHISKQSLFSSGRNPYWLDDELHRVLELEETHELQPDDKEMISSIIELHDTNVREVMIPRVDMVSADITTDLSELRRLIHEEGHSRIPIYKDSIDHILGVIYAKDLLRDEDAPEDEKTIEELMRTPYVVPETKKADELLREFQREKIHLAIVVDEHGTIAGLVTLEDLIEEIVGEIQDEYDDEEPMYKELPDGSIIVDAKLNIDALNEMLDIDITPEEFETIGGLVYKELDRVPEPGEILSYRNLRIAVHEVEGQRIIKLGITKLNPEPSSIDENEAIEGRVA